MNNEERTEKLRRIKVWEKINKGIASDVEIAEAKKWSKDYHSNYLKKAPLFSRWMTIKGADLLVHWEGESFNPPASKTDYLACLVFAAVYLRSTWVSDGLQTCVVSSIGTLLPESILGFELLECKSTADVLKQICLQFPADYPRDFHERNRLIAAGNFDFAQLDADFNAALNSDGELHFREQCNKQVQQLGLLPVS